jgi:very-short-patch-repair endonuclease
LWGIQRPGQDDVHVVVPATQPKERLGLDAHRRRDHEAPGRRFVDGIPVTHPVATLVDLASSASVSDGQLEAAVNEADHLDLVDPEHLLVAIGALPRWRGRRRLRLLLEGPIVTLSSTELERRFLPLARAAGLPAPRTQAWLDGHRVDSHWPDLGLVVEADSLRYHRTPFKQARDKRRDNAQAASGLTTLRFTHGQICHEPAYVRRTLATTAQRLSAAAKLRT